MIKFKIGLCVALFFIAVAATRIVTAGAETELATALAFEQFRNPSTGTDTAHRMLNGGLGWLSVLPAIIWIGASYFIFKKDIKTLCNVS